MVLIIIGVIAACMWLVCALIYTWAFFQEYLSNQDTYNSDEKLMPAVHKYELAEDEEEEVNASSKTETEKRQEQAAPRNNSVGERGNVPHRELEPDPAVELSCDISV